MYSEAQELDETFSHGFYSLRIQQVVFIFMIIIYIVRQIVQLTKEKL